MIRGTQEPDKPGNLGTLKAASWQMAVSPFPMVESQVQTLVTFLILTKIRLASEKVEIIFN